MAWNLQLWLIYFLIGVFKGITPMALFMISSSNGNIFRVTGPLCGEFTGDRWIPLTKASDAELRCFLWSWINNREAGDLRRHRAHYDVTVMSCCFQPLRYNVEEQDAWDRRSEASVSSYFGRYLCRPMINLKVLFPQTLYHTSTIRLLPINHTNRLLQI